MHSPDDRSQEILYLHLNPSTNHHGNQSGIRTQKFSFQELKHGDRLPTGAEFNNIKFKY
jgi:hypothetical protein